MNITDEMVERAAMRAYEHYLMQPGVGSFNPAWGETDERTREVWREFIGSDGDVFAAIRAAVANAKGVGR